jgi:YD repeat-containing protein
VYDDLNRLINVNFVSHPVENVTYTYDTGAFGIGRLHSIMDSTGTSTYIYNSLGQITEESRQMNGTPYTTGYDYDDDFNLKTIAYPGGLELTYTGITPAG